MHSSSPLEKRWLPWLFIWIGATALALPFDSAVSDWFHNGVGEDFVRPVLEFVSYMGQYPIHILVLAILWSCYRSRRVLTDYLAVMIGSSIICTAIKYAVGRARPELDLGHMAFHPFSFGMQSMNSFPSGDATAALALATLLAVYFPRAQWIFFTLGAWASLGRVAAERHFLSDTIFGAGLGIACAIVGLRLLHANRPHLAPHPRGLHIQVE